MMKIVSVNIGEKRQVIWRGKPVFTGIYKEAVDKPLFLGTHDVDGDHVVDRRYHGGLDKACYIYSRDNYPYWQERFPMLDMPPGIFGENLTVEGMNDADLNIGDIYTIGEAEVQISQPRQPCFKLGIRFSNQMILKDFISAPYPGAYLRVLRPGTVKVGDTFQLIETHADQINLVDLYKLMYTGNKEDFHLINELLTKEIIPDECKDGLRKRLNSSTT